MNGIGIKVVESAWYLGDLFNIKGDNSDMCRERHLKAKGTSVELCSQAEVFVLELGKLKVC